jgi:hypothetical protein
MMLALQGLKRRGAGRTSSGSRSRLRIRSLPGTPICRPFRTRRVASWEFPGMNPWAELCSPCGAKNADAQEGKRGRLTSGWPRQTVFDFCESPTSQATGVVISEAFENKTVLITRGISGIGKTTALAFAKEGAIKLHCRGMPIPTHVIMKAIDLTTQPPRSKKSPNRIKEPQVTIRSVLAWRKDRSKAQSAIAGTCTRPGAFSPHPRQNCLLPSGKA